ncbi:hypothetical protein M422DRAFT_98498, partial [Sphaerobolus stellatus SS14]
MATLTGRAAMPAPGSNCVPKIFDGNEDDIAEFLEQFENCAEDAQLADEDKVSFIIRYLARQQKDIFKSLDGYLETNWTVFRAAIQEAFEGAFKEKKYTHQSLIQYTRNNAAMPIRTDTELRTYQRGFNAITKYLLKQKVITEEEQDRYFWFGFHEDNRRHLEQKLETTHPDHPPSKAYKWTDVFKAGKYIFDAEAFKNNPPEGLDTSGVTASIMELDVKIQGKHTEVGIYDPGAELVCISETAARELGLPFSTDLQLTMRDTNGGSKATFGIIENLQLVIGGISVYVHAWIIKNAPYRLLLGRPFQI